MLRYGRNQSIRAGNQVLKRGTAILSRGDGFSYREPEIQVPGTRGVEFDLPDSAVSFGHTHTLQLDPWLNRQNEMPTDIDLDNTMSTELPNFILTPSDRVIMIDFLSPGLGWYEVSGGGG